MIIFSDVDGTLISSENYHPDASIPALKLCKEKNIPVVLVSSKTRAELIKLRHILENEEPFISENGGGIFFPKEKWEKRTGWVSRGEYWALILGKTYPEICHALKESAKISGANCLGFSQMSINQVQQYTNLDEATAKLAKERDFGEPFIILNEIDFILQKLIDEVSSRGFKITRGKRFYHIVSKTGGKGEAVKVLISLYREKYEKVKFAAIGDASNDRPMLEVVDFPYLVLQSKNLFDKEAFFEGVKLTKSVGPEGFAEAVYELLERLNI